MDANQDANLGEDFVAGGTQFGDDFGGSGVRDYHMGELYRRAPGADVQHHRVPALPPACCCDVRGSAWEPQRFTGEFSGTLPRAFVHDIAR